MRRKDWYYGHPTALSGKNHGTRYGVLGIEDAAQRHRTRAVHGTGSRAARCGHVDQAVEFASPERAGFLRRARHTGHVKADRFALRQYGRDGDVSRSEQALL